MLSAEVERTDSAGKGVAPQRGGEQELRSEHTSQSSCVTGWGTHTRARGHGLRHSQVGECRGSLAQVPGGFHREDKPKLGPGKQGVGWGQETMLTRVSVR